MRITYPASSPGSQLWNGNPGHVSSKEIRWKLPWPHAPKHHHHPMGMSCPDLQTMPKTKNIKAGFSNKLILICG